jgi:glycosyltransferase involved in cell wall biosynthesis
MRSFEDIERALSAGPPQMPERDPSCRTFLFETLWYDEADGWAISSRGHARAMINAGIDVRMQSWMPLMSKTIDQHELAQMSPEEIMKLVIPEKRLAEMINPAALAEIGGLERVYQKGSPFGFYLFSTTLGGPAFVTSPLNMLLNYPRPRAFYTMFERCHVIPETAEQLKQLDGLWVLCSKNADELRRHGVEATVIPPCYRDDDPVRLARRYKARGPNEPLKFYWIGRNEPRKAMDNVVRAFLRAFKEPGEATLTLKMSPIKWRGDTLSVEDVIRQEFNRPFLPDELLDPTMFGIHIIDARLTREEMAELHASHHVYVSASRGEGWDLPAFEAKLVGNRVISTDSGGPRDFLHAEEGDHLIPATGEVPAHPRYWWGPGATYIDYDLNEIVKAMRVVHDTEQPPLTLDNLERFRQKNIGPAIKKWVEGIWK